MTGEGSSKDGKDGKDGRKRQRREVDQTLVPLSPPSRLPDFKVKNELTRKCKIAVMNDREANLHADKLKIKLLSTVARMTDCVKSVARFETVGYFLYCDL